MKTTLYNHKHIGTDDRPLIKNIEFKELVERIKIGDIEYYNECLQKFTMVKGQLDLCQYLINNKNL
jgi:hypothetical protein